MRVELVGREVEVGAVTAALAAACAGRPQLLVCRGEAGIGKTRLAEELAARAAGQGVPVLWGRATEAAGAPAYWPWTQILRALPSGSGETAALTHGTDAVTDGAAADQRFRQFDAVTRALTGQAAAAGLVVVLDDAHQADRPSLLLLQHLAAALTDQRVLVLVTTRPEAPAFGPVLAELLRIPATSRLDLAGLPAGGVARLLAAVRGHDVADLDPDEVARVHAATGGNPFLVVEVGRSGGAAVPGAVGETVRHRLDRLDGPVADLVRLAAVGGRDVDPAVLGAALRLPRAGCRRGLAAAAAAGFVEPSAAGYRFVHALVGDAVVATLPDRERARLHAALARALERVHGGDLDPHLPDLARHWAAAGEQARASDRAERAADAAARALGYEEAARLYRMALDTAGNPPPQRRHRLLLGLGRSLFRSGAQTEAWTAVDAAARLARDRDSPDLLAATALAVDCTSFADWDRRVRDLCAEALAALPGPSAERVRIQARLAEAQVWTGQLDAARTHSAAALADARTSGDGRATLDALRARQLACAGPDGVDERAEVADQLVELGAAHADPAAELAGHRGRIDVALARGDLDGAAAALELLSWLTGAGHGPTADWYVHRYRAVLAQARGEFTAAREAADTAFATIAPLRHPAAFPIRMSLLVGLDHHLGGDPTAAHVLSCLRPRPGGAATPGHAYLIMDFLCPAAVLVQAGLTVEAAPKFRALGPVPGWSLPEEHRLTLWAFAVLVGVAVDAPAELAAARDRLAAHRGRHVVDSAHVTLYLGPVELYLGKAARHLGELDRAAADLQAALAACRANGARGFAVEAGYELAAVLAARAGAGDEARAMALAAEARDAAEALGMRPYVKALDDLADELAATARPTPLTARELEVAALVARGHTNAGIARELFISPRTAETHVQHILDKLDLPNRSQIAVWFREHATRLRTSGP